MSTPAESPAPADVKYGDLHYLSVKAPLSASASSSRRQPRSRCPVSDLNNQSAASSRSSLRQSGSVFTMRLVTAVLGLCLLAGLGQSASITYKSGLRRDLCSWGAQYWCSSPKTATLCGKTEWCSNNYWNRQVLSEPVCSTGHDLIKHARKVLGSSEEKPTSEYETAKLIATGCSVLKEQDARLLCKEIVTHHEYLPRLVELVDSKLPIQSVAEAVGVCKRQAPKQEVHEPEACITCEDVVTVTQKHALRHLSLDVYKKMFTSQCAKFGSRSKACHDVAMQKYKDFYHRIVGVKPSSVCTVQNQCISKKGRLSPIKAKSEVCTTCEMVISDIRSLDQDTTVEGAIRGLLNETCKYMGEFENLCMVMVDQGLEYVFEIIATELEPEVICQELHLCSGDGMKAKAKPVVDSKVELTGVKCVLCEFMMREVDKTLLSNSTEEAILKILDQVCSRLPPSIAQQCEELLNQYKPEILKLLTKELAPKNVCSFLGLCTKEMPAASKNEKQSDDRDCAICEFVVKVIDDILMANETEDALEKLLENVCDRLPKNIRSQCDRFVGIYSPQLLALIVSNMRAEQICIVLKLCPAMANKVLKYEPKQTIKQDSDGELCELCKYLVNYIDEYLQKNSTEEQIEKFLDNVCSILPSELNQTCRNLIEQYGPALVKLLVQGLDPTHACTSVGLCKSMKVKMVESDSDVGCAVCEMVMHQLDSIIGDKATAAEVEAGLERVCSLLPESVRAKCAAYVDEYTPFILQVIAAEIKPKEVCSLLKLCPKTNMVKANPGVVKVNKVKDDTCEVCKLAVSALDSMLKANATKEDVTAALEKVCSILPAALKPQCDAFVSEYASYVVDIIVSDLKPDAVCEKLKLCSAGKKTQVEIKRKRENAGEEVCNICLMTFTILENLLPQNATEEIIIETLRNEVCERLPDKMKNQCKSMVQIYLHYVVDLIVSELPPQKICSSIGLCHNATYSALIARSMVKKLKSEPGPICIECEVLLSELQRDMKNPGFEQNAEAKLFLLCAQLPTSVSATCRKLVHEGLPDVLKLLSAFTPDTLCALANLCENKAQTKVPSPVKDSSQCTICEFIMTELDNILADNSTQQQIEQALEQVCNFLPASVKHTCDAFVAQYTPELIQLLLQLKPAQACTYLRLCSSKGKKPTPQENIGPQCVICQFAINKLEQILSANASEEQIEQALERVCNFLPASVKQECDNFIDQYTPQLLHLLQSVAPGQICSFLGLCSTSSPVKVGPQCVICEFVITELDNILAANSTKQQIELALDTVCNFLPTSVRAQCDDLIHQYTPQLVQLLLQFSPDQVCTRLRLCSNKASESSPPVNAGPTCTICEFIMTELDNILAKNATQQQIEQAVDQICNFLPASVKDECDSFVKRYAPQIVQLLLQVAPDQICTLLGLCSNQFPVDKSAVDAGPQCVICEFVMNELDNILGNNATQEEIKQALENVCNFLPASVKQECDSFVAQYTPELIQLLLQVKPSQVCGYLGLCSSKLTVDAGPQCVICEFVMNELDSILSNNATQEEIKQALENVCNFLPASVKQECDSFVAQYTPELIQLLLQVKPSQVCGYLGLCSSKLTGSEGPTCVLCEFVMTQLEKILASTASQQQIEQAVDQVCNFLPASVKQECDSFVKKYTPTLIQLLLQVKPSQVCTYMKLCTSKNIELKVRGPVTDTVQCTLCKFLMGQLDKMLADNSTEKQIEQGLEQVCDSLPEDIRPECHQFVKQYLPRLVEILLTYKPDDVCKMLAICTKTSVAAKVESSVQDGPQCTICEFAMTQLEGLLAKNSTEQQIEKALDQVCNFLPATVKQECDTFVKQYTPTLIQLLLQVKPDQICTYLQLCSSKLKAPKPVHAGAMCVVCEALVKEFENVVGTNATKKKIETFFDQACNIVPSNLKQQCDQIVATFTPEVLNLLLEIKPDQWCSAIQVCQPSFTQVSSPVKNGPLCVICEFVLSQLDQILAQNATKEQIEQALNEVCSFLPATVQQQCNAFVKQYFEELVVILLQYKPAQICTVLGLCENSRSSVSKPNIGCIICDFVMVQLDELMTENTTQEEIRKVLDRACTVLPYESWKKECVEFVDKYTPDIIELLLVLKPEDICINLKLCPNNTVAAQTGPQCTLCEFVLSQLDNMLSDNATQAQIETALEKVCNILPPSVKDECDTLVKQYAPQLILLLLQFKPQQVCTRLGLCTSKSPAQVSKVRDGPQCTICEFVMTELDNMLSDNATQAQIEAALEKVCNMLPPSVKDECDTLVKQYAPQLIQLLLQFKPQQVCTRLGLCTSKSPAQVSKVRDGPQCTICEFVMTELDNMLSENATQAQIEAALEKVCNILPPSVKDECDTLVKQYAPQLIQLLLQFKPQQVCTRLGLCTSKSPAQVSKVRDGPQCTICEFVMTELDNMLSDNATQAQIEAALEKVCNMLPPSVKDECDTLVKQYAPQLIQLLLQFKPQQVCTRLGLCTSKSPAQVSKVRDGPQCTICEFVMTELDNMLSENATQAQIEAALEKVCNILPPSVKDECDTLVKQYAPQLIQLLLQFKPQQVCTRLGLCTSKSPAQVSKVRDGPQCTICEFVMTELDNMLSDNATQAQIEAALEKVCNMLPPSVKDECDTLVKQYAPQLIQLLLQFKPQQVCTRLGLCTSKSPAQVSKVRDGPQCTICEFVMTELDNMLSENATQAQIEAALEKVCNILPPSVKDECDTLVKQYAPQLIQLLLQFKPQQVCTRLGLCTSKSPAQVSKVRDGPQCTICEFVMTELDNMLSDNATQAQIEAALEKVCNMLPPSVKDECDTLVKQYAPQLIQLLLQFKPQQVCTRLGLCTSKSPAQVSKVRDGPQCTICEFVMTELDNMLSENATQAQIEAALEKVCNILPPSVKDECDTLVKQYAPQLIQLLLQFKPQQVCTRLGLCTSKSPAQVSKVRDGPQCTICEFVMTELDNMLSDNATQAQIEAALEKVCNMLPPSVKDECDTLVKQYAPQLIQLLLQFKPQQVCTRLGLCTSKTLASKAVSDGPLCIICEFVVKQLDNLLAENSTQAQIEMALEIVCNILPDTVKHECAVFVERYSPQLVQLLLRFKPQEVCTRLGVCNSSVTVVRPVKGGPECVLCEFIMNELEKTLGDNATEAQIKSALEQVCSFLPASLRDACDSFIEKNLPELIQLLLQVKPKQVCTYLGVCNSQHTDSDGAAECYLCEFVMAELEKVVLSGAGVAGIESALKNVCFLMPASLQENCRYFVVDFTPGILKLLAKKVTPGQVCEFIKVCAAPPAKTASDKMIAGSSDLCDFCEYVIQYLDNVLKENITKEEIEEAVHKVCSFVPAEVKDFCDKFLEEQAEVIINKLVETLNPEGLCTSAGLCNDHSSNGLSAMQAMDKAEFCEVCEKIALDVDKLLQQNFTEQAVEAALHEVCKAFESKAKESCENFVSQYTSVLIEVLQSVPPEQICIALKMCPPAPAPSTSEQANSLQFVPEADQSSTALDRPIKYHPYCSTCKFLFYYLQTSMVDSFWQDTAKNSMYEFCNQLKVGQDVCKLLMDMNADHVLGDVRGFRFPETFCQSSAMCEPPFNDDNSVSRSINAVSQSMVIPPSDASSSFPHCTSCKFLASQLNGVISQPFWRAQVRTSLDEMCDLMTYGKDVCKRVIEENIGYIINNVSASEWPEQICQAISLCEVPSKKVQSTGEIACGLCEKISETAHIFLKSGATSTQVMNYLEMACSTSTDDVEKDRCLTVVRQYAPELLDILKTEQDPKAACKTVDVCFSS
ncbi:hypothetical protein RRG08_056678 [Elysia crispata]|uniref:Pulmonary surfactant-associated protein B n=1 Tax=Elysia crispata TaxID=231223 RepID=A0AAE0YG08_9GAST|nr:hypothetical protein RRG08_056678 [Elysia crispata]